MDLGVEVRTPTAEMELRLLAKLRATIPSIDLADCLDRHNPSKISNRSAAPEIAQEIYMNALRDECAIGDYINIYNNSVVMTDEIRLYMITVMIEVHKIK